MLQCHDSVSRIDDVFHYDDVCEAILEYGKDKIGPNDVVCIAESVVAIIQGRAMRCEEFKPSLLAKVLCRLFPSKGSISSWYSMQALIDAEGGMRVLTAVICGFAAKCVGVSGVFLCVPVKLTAKSSLAATV